MPTPRTGNRLQDSLLDRLEAVAAEAAAIATLSYSRAVPALPRDIHDQINALADTSGATADAYFRVCAVPPVLRYRNPMDEIAARMREMARAGQITLELVDSNVGTSPMHLWLREHVEMTVETYRQLDVMARVLALVPMASEAEPMETDELPDPPAAAAEDTIGPRESDVPPELTDPYDDVPEHENVGQDRVPADAPIGNEVFDPNTSEPTDIPADEAQAADDLVHLEIEEQAAAPDAVLEEQATIDAVLTGVGDLRAEETAMLEALNA